jgi:hypothetical protein
VGTVLLAVGAGCHSSTANLGGFSSSIPGGTQFDQLSSAQVQTFCNEVDAFDTSSGQDMDALEITCLFGGLIAAELSAAPQTNASVQAACTTAYNQCLAGATSTFSCPSTAALAGCTATVSEYAACLNDATKIEVQTIQSLPTCADLTVADLVTSSGTVSATPLPPSCQTLNAKCPTLGMGGAGGSDGGTGPDAASPTDAAGAQAPAACTPPAAEGGPDGVELGFRSTWCDSARSCATCVWDVIETVPLISGTFVPTTTTCSFMPIACPAASGATAASPPSCSYRPDAGHYDGVLINGYPTASGCQAINSELVGLNSLPFDVAPCTLDGFVCVADCSACP